MNEPLSAMPAGRGLRPGTVLIRWGIYGCFFLSGATALIFEVLWSRQFVTVFGNSAYAVSIVLCAYMAGLGLGGLYGGRLADRITQRVAAYAIVQAAVAIWALIIPSMLVWLRTVVPTLSILSSESLLVSTLVRFGLSFAILAVPCFMMGTTLPLLARAVTESDKSIGLRIGILYCLNTLGAAVGCLAAGFWMLDTLGIHKTNLAAAAANFAIAGIAFILSKPMTRVTSSSMEQTSVPESIKQVSLPSAPSGALLLTAAFVNGLAGLACEVLWMRYLGFLNHLAYVFPTILSVYLLGMGLGGFIYSVLARWIGRSVRTLGIVEILLGLSVPATVTISALIFAGGPPRPLELKGMTFITVFWPTVLMGMAFPLLCAVYGLHVGKLGRRIGLLLAVNTAGTVAGSLLPLFVLVPWMGIQNGLLLMSVLYAAMGLVLLAGRREKNRRLGLIAGGIWMVSIIGFGVYIPSDLCQRVFLATGYSLAKHTDILFYEEGRTGTAIVTQDRASQCKTVYINGVSEVPLLYAHQLDFKLIGDLAPMIHPNPNEVLMICFGGGIAAGATSCLPDVKSLTIVELESSVVEAARLLGKENNNLLENPKAHVVIDDGRNYIMTAQRKWPVIISDSTHPRSGDSWVLYTQEFYELVRDHLTEDGIFLEWVPTHGLSVAEFKIIVRTFQTVFPHTSLWVASGIDEQGGFVCYSMLMGTAEALKIDIERLSKRLENETVRQDLEPYGLHTPAGFLDSFLCAEDTLKSWVGDGPLNTDDMPYTQYMTQYTQGESLEPADYLEPMEDIWPYLVNTGSDQQTADLRHQTNLRMKINRLVFMDRRDEAYTILPDDIRYRRMRQLREGGPAYVRALMDIYWDNPDILLDHLVPLMVFSPGGMEAAVPIYKRILELDPDNVLALTTLGIVNMEADNLKEAEEYLRRAIKAAPYFYDDAHYNLGLVLEKMGQKQEAIEQWKIAAQTSEMAAAELGDKAAQDGFIADSIPWFRKALEIKPTFIDARLCLVVALLQTGQTEEAISHIRLILKMDPENGAALKLAAQLKENGIDFSRVNK